MNVRLLYTFLLCGAGSLSLLAQTFSPLGGYDFPVERTKPLPVFPKMDCSPFDDTDVVRLLPGESVALPVRTDTTALDGAITYNCNGCPIGQFGTGEFSRDTFFYTASPTVEEGLETFIVRTCEQADPNNCSPDVTITILVQRPPTTVDLGNQTVEPGGTADVDIPLGNLPGATFCRTVESCGDEYAGREQRVFFQFGINDDNEIRYVAARAAGTDRVCVTLCTELGLCDTYTTSFTINRPTLDLPFFDDFSYDDFRPDFDLWQDEDVLVNRNFAVRPPSIGVATFDGVDFDGRPYTDVNGTGPTRPRDYLTSAPINLQGANGTTLNFYLQPRGLGNRPERQDSFVVQFLSEDGDWRTVFGVEGIINPVGNDTPLPFEAYTLPLASEYFYNGFQFRFFNKGNEQGAVDMWHLDYVKLDNASPTILTNDLAIVEAPVNFLRTYTSLPLRHYQQVGAGLLRDSVDILLFNHAASTNTVSNGSNVLLSSDGITVRDGNLLSANLFGMPLVDNDNAVASQTFFDRSALLSDAFYFDELVNFLDAQDADASLKLFHTYSLVVENESPISPLAVENNRVSTPICFGEYFAYDDGTAETTLEIGEDNTILQAYDTYVNDEMVGVQIRLPRGLGDLGDQALKLVVYTGDTSPVDLVYEEEFEIVYPEELFFDSLQGYTTYRFDEVLDLPAGTIYVGWEQQRANRNIGVGFDRNNSPENVQWFNVGNGFERLTGTTTGAIMIRPLLSGFADFQTDTDNPDGNVARLEVFPNPTNGTLHLRPRPGTLTGSATYRLFNFAGALVRTGAVTPLLQLAELPAGVYLLEVNDGTHREQHKIIRR